MSELSYPSVNQALLADVVERLQAVGKPLKVVLFGSHARGDSHATSDLDLLVVEESDLPRHQRSPQYYKALAGVFPAKDITVWTPAEIQDWSAVPNAFVTTALREGKILYEKPA